MANPAGPPGVGGGLQRRHHRPVLPPLPGRHLLRHPAAYVVAADVLRDAHAGHRQQLPAGPRHRGAAPAAGGASARRLRQARYAPPELWTRHLPCVLHIEPNCRSTLLTEECEIKVSIVSINHNRHHNRHRLNSLDSMNSIVIVSIVLFVSKFQSFQTLLFTQLRAHSVHYYFSWLQQECLLNPAYAWRHSLSALLGRT